MGLGQPAWAWVEAGPCGCMTRWALWWGRSLNTTRLWDTWPCQRASGVGHALWGVVLHPDISSECGAHVLHVVNAKPAACHCSTQEGELFSWSPPYSSSDEVPPAFFPFVSRDKSSQHLSPPFSFVSTMKSQEELVYHTEPPSPRWSKVSLDKPRCVKIGNITPLYEKIVLSCCHCGIIWEDLLLQGGTDAL